MNQNFQERGFVTKIQRRIFCERHVNAPPRYLLWSCVLLSVLAVLMLGGCAADKMNREGQQLLDEGRYEEGLSKLQDASKADPDNMNYRIEMRRNREQIVNSLLAGATEARASDHRDVARANYQRILHLDPANKRAKGGLEELAMDERHDKLIAELQAQVQPAAMGAALSKNARDRGL